MIELSRIRVVRGKSTLLELDALSLSRGELVGIVGPNGAGKSTLLDLLSGDSVPTAGKVLFDGKETRSIDPSELARLRAVLSQTSSAAFPFTVFELVLLGRTPFGSRETEEDREIAGRALDLFDLSGLAQRNHLTLSGGEKQRVHLARVFAQISLGRSGQALFLDEPTSALDPAHQQLVLGEARKIADQGLVVAVVLHDLNLAAQYCDRLVMLKSGRLVRSGTPVETLTVPLLEEVFQVRAHVGESPWAEDGALLVSFSSLEKVSLRKRS